METIKCRECKKELSLKAIVCPSCGAMYPANPSWKGWGYEKRSHAMVGEIPLYHIAFGFDEGGRLRKANGFFAIGQFAKGYFVLAQFGTAYIFGIGQFILSPIAVAQFALGLLTLGQISIGIISVGQFAVGVYSLCMAGFAYKIWSQTFRDPEAVLFFTKVLTFIKTLF